MTESKTANIFRYWYDALARASRHGIDGMMGFCGEDPVCIAKLRILWILHAGRYLYIHMHTGEVYEEWEKCTELSRDIIDKAVQDTLSEEFCPEDAAEIKRFIAGYAEQEYEVKDIKKELHTLFCDADEKTLEQIDEEIRLGIQYARFTLYDFEFARKDEAKGKNDSGEPPAGLDEFEYIDWVISHS